MFMSDSRQDNDPFGSLSLRDRSPTLVQLVTDQIESMIRDRRLVAGDQLPNERELCRQFGVSRTVVREAIARLIARHLLEVRGGSGGIVVRAPSTETVSDALRLMFSLEANPLEHAKVLEVRRLLEVEIAGLAAERRTPADIEKLSLLLATHEEARDDLERIANIDLDFHMAIAGATQNELFVILLDSLRGILLTIRRLGYSTPGNPERALRYHRAILAEIKAGNVKGAREAMQSHLFEAEETVHLALALRQNQLPDEFSQGAPDRGVDS
jgi:GntR family transcriptional repressor for pyruvate dehydrogenase complex